MAENLFETAELAHRQLFPEGSGTPPVTLEEFIATAKKEYAAQMWVLSKNEKNQEGNTNVPAILLSQVTLKVQDNMVDLSGLEILRSLSNDQWLQNIGGWTCKCKYIKSSLNDRQLLCDDDSIPDDSKLFFVVGNKIMFPRGTHSNELPIIYANKGLEVDDRLEIDDAVASIIRTKLIETYGGKTGKEDVTNNENPND